MFFHKHKILIFQSSRYEGVEYCKERKQWRAYRHLDDKIISKFFANETAAALASDNFVYKLLDQQFTPHRSIFLNFRNESVISKIAEPAKSKLKFLHTETTEKIVTIL